MRQILRHFCLPPSSSVFAETLYNIGLTFKYKHPILVSTFDDTDEVLSLEQKKEPREFIILTHLAQLVGQWPQVFSDC